MRGRWVRRVVLFVFGLLIIFFLFHFCHASSAAFAVYYQESGSWCEKTGSGTEILLFLSPDMTWGELEKELGFGNSLRTDISRMVAVWNDMPLPLETDVPIGRSVLKSCYYWTFLPIYDSCLDANGNLAVCEVGAELVLLKPTYIINSFDKVAGLVNNLNK